MPKRKHRRCVGKPSHRSSYDASGPSGRETKTATTKRSVRMTSRKNFFWYELMTTDMKAAEAFYTKVVGWRAETWPGAMPYTIVNAADKGVGGIMILPEEAAQMGVPPCWVGYIKTDNVDAATKGVVAAGGSVKR